MYAKQHDLKLIDFKKTLQNLKLNIVYVLPTKIYIIEVVVVELSAWKWKSNQAENVSTLTILLKKPNHTETGGFYNMIFPSKYEPIKSFWSIFRLYLIRCTIVELL